MTASPAPTIKQSLAALTAKRFPWLTHFVTVAGAKGRGLAIRAAGGLIHLAGGPDDPGVVRIGDAGTAGTITATGNIVTITNAAGSVFTLTFTYVAPNVVIVAAPPALPFDLATKSTAGSAKVTCG